MRTTSRSAANIPLPPKPPEHRLGNSAVTGGTPRQGDTEHAARFTFPARLRL